MLRSSLAIAIIAAVAAVLLLLRNSRERSGPALIVGMSGNIELEGVAAALLDDEEFLTGAVRKACSRGNLTIIDLKAHSFSPIGVSVVAILAESHISVHTWPERRYAALDIFTCGQYSNPRVAVQAIIDELDPLHNFQTWQQRGPTKIRN